MLLYADVSTWLRGISNVGGGFFSVVAPIHANHFIRENNNLPDVFEKGILSCLTRPTIKRRRFIIYQCTLLFGIEQFVNIMPFRVVT